MIVEFWTIEDGKSIITVLLILIFKELLQSHILYKLVSHKSA